MKFSEQWLREWVSPPVSTEVLADQLTMLGLEVEGLTTAAPNLHGVVAGRVEAIEKHPHADKLSVCTVRKDGGCACYCRDWGAGHNTWSLLPLCGHRRCVTGRRGNQRNGYQRGNILRYALLSG